MNEQLVRVHLRQAILVGSGCEARYTKVLIGERKPVTTLELGDLFAFEEFLINGYVRGYQVYNLTKPATHRLQINNILAIEDIVEERLEPHYMRRAAADAAVYVGTPKSLWEGPGHLLDIRKVERARRIIQLCVDGRYRIVKGAGADFAPKNEVIFLYDEGSR